MKDDTVEALKRDGDVFHARCKTQSVAASTILLATGVVNNRPQIDEATHQIALQQGFLRYCPICDGYEITDRKVAVIGTSGFDISANDLDMRGGGDLLGDTQAGHMKLIGIELYQHLLSQALREARGETLEDWSPDLRIEAPAWLPAEWIPEVDIRLGLYIRLARLGSESAIENFEVELVDRFGPLPDPAAALLGRARLSLQARAINIARIDAGPAAIALTPRPSFSRTVQIDNLVEKDGRLLLGERTTAGDRIARIQQLMEDLG